MDIYLTQNGVQDISGLDEDQKVKFLLENPDAVKATSEDLRIRGYGRPNSEIEQEQEDVNEIFIKERNNSFAKLKFGTYSPKEGYRSGGKGDKVSREDFDTDQKWYEYQVWNGDIKEKEVPLDEQIQKRIRQNDLDVDADSSHLFYNQENENSFVNKFYNARDLENLGGKIQDFQGFLNRNGHSEDFKDFYNEGAFEDGLFGAFGDQSEELRIAYERQLSLYLDMYISDVNNRANEKIFLEDYNSNPNKYSTFKTFDDAFNSWREENDGGYSVFDYDNYKYYNNVHFKNKLFRDQENKEKQNEYLKNRADDNDFEGGGKGLLEFIGNGLEGIYEGFEDTSVFLGDLIGADGWANESRMLKRESDLADPAKQMKYMLTMGKTLEVDGVRYSVDNYDGQLYNQTVGVNVGETMDPEEKAKLVKKIKEEGVYDYDFNTRGAAGIMGNTLGNILFQILGTKGAGSIRTVGSLKYLQGYNKIRQLKGLKPLSTRARNTTTGRFASTKETFGINMPFDPRIVDATMFQAFYGASTGHENVLNAALDAGIPFSEAEKLANSAALQMALLYAVTGPINPRLPGLNKLDDWVAGNVRINNVITAYKEGGKEAAKKSLKQQLSRLIPDRTTLKTFINEGFKEFVQENVQQLGEVNIVNRDINEQYGQEFLKQNYNLKDFIQTSILSFAAGGLVGGTSVANFATPDSKKARLANMVILGRDLKGTKQKLNLAVDRNKLTRKEADELINQIKALSEGSFPAWMFNTPDELIQHAVIQQDIKKLEADLKKYDESQHKKINNELATKKLALQDLVESAAQQAIESDIKLFKDTFNVETIQLNNLDEIIKAGFKEEAFTDGWLEQDGKIYINMEAAKENQAVSVASHELLHKIIKSEFKKNPNIGKVVTEFKNILEEKGVLSKLEPRAKKYRIIGSQIDEGGKDQDEWLTMFSDALFKNEITYEELGDNAFLRMGRTLINVVKKKFGLKQYEFETGRQVYDFILNYKENIEKGKLSKQEQRMLDSFQPDDESGKKKSISMNEKINQEKLDALVNPNEEFIGSKAHMTAKALIDTGSFDGLIGAKLEQGDNIYGKPRQEVIEDARFELVKHLNNYDPTIGTGLFGYLNSYVGFKLGNVTNRLKRQVKTKSIDVDREGTQKTQEIQDTSLNPEEIMIAKEQAAAAQKIASKIKMGKKLTVDEKKKAITLLLPIVRDLDTALNNIKSINAKNSPIIKEIKNALGSSLVYDEMIKLLGTRDNLRKKLLSLKEDILANSTTTWLMGKDTGVKVNGGIPQVIEKTIKLENGDKVKVAYPEWIGQEIAREKMSTDNAGRTSGHDLVFRSDNAIELDDDVYLSQFYDAKGKLIRGRKEALAKHMAQEIGLELMIDEIVNNPNGPLAQEFNKNQLAKNVVNAVDKINQFMEQAERGGVKRSLSRGVAIKYYEAAVILGAQGSFTELENHLNDLPKGYEFIKDIYEKEAFETESITGFLNPLKAYSKTKAGAKIKPYLDEFLNMSPDEKKKAIVPFSSNLAGILPGAFFDAFQNNTEIKALLGIHKRTMSKEDGVKVFNKVNKSRKGGVPFTNVKVIQAGYGFVLKIQDTILNKKFKSKKEAEQAFEEAFGEDIKKVNANNLAALVYILEKAQSIVAANPKLIPGYLTWLQANGNVGKALRGLTKIEEVQIYADNQAPFVDLDGKGYNSIRAKDRARYINNQININYNHPDYKEAKAYIDQKDADREQELQNPKLSQDKRDQIQRQLDKSEENKIRERLRAKGEHKNPSSNTFSKIAMYQLGVINTMLENPGSDLISLATEQDLMDLVSDFSQSIGTEILSAIQDDIHGRTTSIGDMRVMAIPENKIKSFYAVTGETQALSRAQRAIDIKIKEFAQVLANQNLIERSRSVSVETKGISVYDFDDTLAFSDSKVIVVMPQNLEGVSKIDKLIEQNRELGPNNAILRNRFEQEFLARKKKIQDLETTNSAEELRALHKKAKGENKEDIKLAIQEKYKVLGPEVVADSQIDIYTGKVKKITPAQFAAQDEKLKAQGAIFDFSEFNQVVKGRPGPLAPRIKKAIDKFGNENIFVLTARPQASAKAIHEFLKGIGIEIPLENITGLENGTPAAKAGWVINKVAQGFNDFYFVDDAYKNVQAVQNVLNVFDVKGKVQQAIVNRKRSLSGDLNKMVERNTGVRAETTYSKIAARKKGASKGKYKFFSHSADDFRGLTSYTLAGKGKQGEQDQKFFEDNLVTPYVRGVGAIEAARQALKNDYRTLLKAYPELKKNLDKEIGDTGFTLDQAIRVYLYNKSGFEVPGISKRDQGMLINVVNQNPDYKNFADTLQIITKKQKWAEPEEYWDVGSILKDLNELDQKVSRKEYLAEFIENVDTIFSEQNLNKLEALYGSSYRKALENIIGRMKSGSNRPGQMGEIEGKWMNWVNNSVGTIMFFNRRSALLQMISFTNFVNWSDNNPLAAAAAFADQKNYWKTWSRIFNSDKLKQRRGGLRSDVQEQEIANAAKNSKDKVSAIISYLLKIGFTPTQIADSMAIATGGATFLMNRTKTYLKQGMSQQDADTQAFEDFVKISDETQQSGDPMLISKQQASHLGRLILAFQNTPMQYVRLMKKATQDLVNRRGDDKTNISKIMYYGFVQNLLFASLQNALFALLPEFDPEDDDEKRQKIINTKTERILNGMLDTILRGSGLAGAVVSTLKNTINRYYKEEKKGFTADHAQTLIELLNVSPPIGSKARKLYGAHLTKKYNKELIDERGMSLLADGRLNISPSYEILGSFVSATFNIPLDRAIVELNSISEALDNRNSAYQRIALLLGWRTWDVNAKNEENDFIELVYDELKEIEKKKKRRKRK